MDKVPALDAKLVEEFVGNAHGNFARVKELLESEPALVNATWDWGGGDFETALGAAAHMGNKQIANYLLEHGARLDIFAAAMLDKVEVVKAALIAYPEAVNTPGPHGIPLYAQPFRAFSRHAGRRRQKRHPERLQRPHFSCTLARAFRTRHRGEPVFRMPGIRYALWFLA